VDVDRRSKKIAAALAAVETLLAEEAAAAAAPRPRPAAVSGPSPWALAGRLAVMAARNGLGAAKRT
jgi:hypothetical protein